MDPAPLPPAGWSVSYHRCRQCGFLFSDFLDGWSRDRLSRELYNADYVRVDPEIAEVRPARVADLVTRMFGAARTAIRVLDYGGGDGALARKLAACGFADVTSADPFFGSDTLSADAVDLMLCVEVIEHLTIPDAAFAAARAAIKPDGVVFFTTVLQPSEPAPPGLDWWYVAPRNGHVSLHTAASLRLVTARHGLELASINDTLHLAWRGTPRFAATLIERVRGLIVPH